MSFGNIFYSYKQEGLKDVSQIIRPIEKEFEEWSAEEIKG
jgi:hypothetical protein